MANPIPRISVFISCRNQVESLAACLDSVLGQTLEVDELVICDDASDDGSWGLIGQYQDRFPDRIVTHRQVQPVGTTRNLVTAQMRCTGDLVCRIDACDRWLPGKLEAEWRALQSIPGAALAYSGLTANCDGSHSSPSSESVARQQDAFVDVFARKVFDTTNLSFVSPLIWREALANAGYYDASLRGELDWDLHLAICAHNPVADSGVEAVIHQSGPDASGAVPSEEFIHNINAVRDKHCDRLAELDRETQTLINRSLDSLTGLITDSFTAGGLAGTPAPEGAPAWTEEGWKGENLVILVSLPRSGSTMLQRLLGTHPDIHTVSEPWVLLHPFYALKNEGVQTDYDAGLARQGLEDLCAQMPAGEEDYVAALRRMVGYLYQQVVAASGKPVFLDKTPRYYRILPQIARVLPRARVILLYRNPLAVLSSVLRSWMGDSTQLLEQTSNYRDMVDGPPAMLEGERILGDQAIRVSYEDLLSDTGAALQRICEFIGIGFEPVMLSYGDGPPLQGRMGDADRVNRHREVVATHAGEWQSHLGAHEHRDYALGYLQALGREIVGLLGYEFDRLEAELRGETMNQDGTGNFGGSPGPRDGVSLNSKGEELFAEGRVAEALDCFSRALEQSPGDADIFNNIGVALNELERPAEALEAFVRGLSLDQDHTQLVVNTAGLLSLLGKQDEAIALAGAYLERHPDDETISALLGQEPAKPEAPVAESMPEPLPDSTRPDSSRSSRSISVLVSTWASEAFMDECLGDLVNQTIFDCLEIIVVDAASPENERAIVERYQAQYSNIRYIRTEDRVGVYEAWNIAIRESTGDYLFTYSTNDRLSPEACENLAVALDQNPDVALVYGDSYLTAVPHQTFARHTRSGIYAWPEYRFEDLLENCLIGPHPMWRRRVHDETGLFDESYVAIGDQEMWLRIGEIYPMLHIGTVTGLYWTSDDALSRKGQLPLDEINRLRQHYRIRYQRRLDRLANLVEQSVNLPPVAQIMQAALGFVPQNEDGRRAMERMARALAGSGQGRSAPVRRAG